VSDDGSGRPLPKPGTRELLIRLAEHALQWGPGSGLVAYGISTQSDLMVLLGCAYLFLYGLVYEPVRLVLMSAAPEVGLALGGAVAERLGRWGRGSDWQLGREPGVPPGPIEGERHTTARLEGEREPNDAGVATEGLSEGALAASPARHAERTDLRRARKQPIDAQGRVDGEPELGIGDGAEQLGLDAHPCLVPDVLADEYLEFQGVAEGLP